MRRDKNRYVRPGVLWYRLYSVFLYSLLLFLSFSVLCGGFLLVFSFSYVCHHPECVCVCVCSNGNHYRRQQERKKKQQLSSRLSNDSPRALAPVLGLLRPGSEKQRQQPAQCIGLIVYIYDYYNLILNTRSTTCLMFQFNKKPNKEPATCDEITSAQKNTLNILEDVCCISFRSS